MGRRFSRWSRGSNVCAVELLAAGRDADVFALDDHRVLRRYRDGRSAQREAGVIGHLTAAGFPTPGVLGGDGPDLVLERVAGPDLMTAMFMGAVTPDDAGVTLADLHRRLHAVPWDGGALVHLDLHPLNVLWTASGPVLLDWTNARPGEPGLDAAITAMILAMALVAPDAFADVGVDGRAIGAAVRRMLTTFAATAEPFTAHLDAAAEYRRSGRNTGDDERAALGEAVALVRSVAAGSDA